MISIQYLDNKRISVRDFLAHINEINYYRIYLKDTELEISPQELTHYLDCTVFMYNEPKEFGCYEDGTSDTFDRLFVEVER